VSATASPSRDSPLRETFHSSTVRAPFPLPLDALSLGALARMAARTSPSFFSLRGFFSSEVRFGVAEMPRKWRGGIVAGFHGFWRPVPRMARWLPWCCHPPRSLMLSLSCSAVSRSACSLDEDKLGATKLIFLTSPELIFFPRSSRPPYGRGPGCEFSTSPHNEIGEAIPFPMTPLRRNLLAIFPCESFFFLPTLMRIANAAGPFIAERNGSRKFWLAFPPLCTGGSHALYWPQRRRAACTRTRSCLFLRNARLSNRYLFPLIFWASPDRVAFPSLLLQN